MRRRIILAAMLGGAIAGVAAPAPAAADQLRMVQADHENIHIAHEGGAIDRRFELVVTVDLEAKQRALVKAIGSRDEHNLWVRAGGASSNTDDSTAWTTSWRGTWAITKGALALELELVKHDCKAQRTTDGTTEPRTSCTAATARAHITCASDTITVTGPDQRDHAVAAWVCTADEASDLAESGASWVFGKHRCVKRVGGHHSSISYSDC